MTQQAKTQPLNVGVVGYGLSGKVFHAPVISAIPELHLKTVVERHAAESRERYPWVAVVREYDALLADPSIDLVVITTPTPLHFPQAKQALEAGKHVVVEKPFTASSAEAAELDALAQSRKRVLSVYQNRRWDGDFLTVQQVVNSGHLGRLVDYECHYDRYRTEPRTAGLWRESSGAGGGILFDLGAHLIDQALTLFGVPEEVTAQVQRQRDFGEADDSFSLMLGYAGGFRATLKSSMLVRTEGPRFVVHGTQGSFVKHGLDPQEDLLRTGRIPGDNASWGTEPASLWGQINTTVNGLRVIGSVETRAGSYQAYYQNVADAILGKAPLAVTAAQGRNTIRVIELAQQSSREKRTLPFAL